MPASGLLPPIVVLPLAVLAVLVITGHLVALQGDAEAPLSRKRIRTANGVLMLVTTVVLAYAFAYTSSGSPGAFALAWGASVLLLSAVLVLSGVDVLNNVRLTRIQRRRLRRSSNDLQSQLAELVGRARERGPATDPDQSPRLVRPPDDTHADRENGRRGADDGPG
jgi:hypothetical protein